MRLIRTAIFILISQSILAEESLIPLKDLVKASDLYNVTISPNGSYLSMIVNPNDPERPYKRSLRIFDLKENKEGAFLNFPRAYSISSATWVNNERLLIRGSEKWSKYSILVEDPNLVSVNWDGSKQQTIFGPKAGKVDMSTASARRTNAGLEEYASFSLIRTLPETPEFVLGYKTPWTWGNDGDWNTYIIKLNVYNGHQETLEKLPFKRAWVLVDNTGRARFVNTHSEQLENELFYRAKDSDSFKSVARYFSSEGGWYPVGFMADNQTVIIRSNQESDLEGLYKLNPDTMERSLIAYDEKGDIGSAEWSAYGEQFLGYWKTSTKPEYHILDESHQESKVYRKFSQAFPGKQISITSTTRNADKIIVMVYSDVDPAAYYLFDTSNGKAIKIGSSRPWMEKKPLSPMNAVDINARDGKRLPSFLTLPVNRAKENLPMVLLVHGGPYGVNDSWGYDEDVQVLASRGYAVLQVNYRGSGGYGRAFEYGAYKQWGTTMQDDLVDAVQWAVKEKIADPKRVCIMGHSYGGYAAVWGAIRDKDLYRCAIGSMGVYDLPYIFEEDNTEDSKRATEFFRQTLGTDIEELKKRSPVYNAARLEIPLLLSHGEEDETAPIEHAYRLKKALDKAHKPYQWIEFDDAGHFFGSEKNQEQFYSTTLAFLEKHIGH